MTKYNFLSPGNQSSPWQGPPRHFFTVFTIKNVLIIVFAILIVVESVMYRKWANNQSYPNPLFGVRNTFPIVADAFLTIVTAPCIATNRWHPITALCTSILWTGVWLTGLVLNVIVPYASEISFTHDDTWMNICYAEAAFQAVIVILYCFMSVYSAKAVHGWRKTRAGGRTDIELRRVSNQSGWNDAAAKV
ncbi:hypothetical protein P280DRAFT_459191 [Massarina eburnea CBS 473.64]|uniref:MARVEL domain-containing protein n=1 Tax=Massarina eburnea CBS 473.64 TaxID=1395130 RepID=A0A6A6RNL8_9PLEO|nr:hypothetical protein P280DRAFT_459191 [Massarina eburnea CBS 473.64]